MQRDNSKQFIHDAFDAREIRELTYWKHLLGVNESAVRSAIAKVGSDRAKIERELKRLG